MTTTEFELFVKPTSNCSGMAEGFIRLGQIWSGERLRLPFGEGDKIGTYDVVGWTDLHSGSPGPVHVAKMQRGWSTGFLVWGGNAGVRVLDDDAEPTSGVDDHLPPGHGRPMLWVDDVLELPREVRDVVERPICARCGADLPLGVSPHWLFGSAVWLCEDCA